MLHFKTLAFLSKSTIATKNLDNYISEDISSKYTFPNLSCCHVIAACPLRHVHADLPSRLVQADLYWLSCPECPVMAVLPLLSLICPCCRVAVRSWLIIPADLSRCPVQAVLSKPSCPSRPVQAILSKLSCPRPLVPQLSCRRCPDMLSCPGRPCPLY
jgi:hypothetical protein